VWRSVEPREKMRTMIPRIELEHNEEVVATAKGALIIYRHLERPMSGELTLMNLRLTFLRRTVALLHLAEQNTG